MDTKTKLLNKLEEQLKIEIMSKDVYLEFLKKIKDKEIHDDIKHILGEEIKHIGIVNELIDLVKGYNKPIREYKGKKVEPKVQFKGLAPSLLLYKTEDYMHSLISIIRDISNERRIIYVSYNKIPKYIKELLRENKFDIGRITFINGVGIESDEGINIRPEDLTKLSIAINQATEKIKDVTIIVDTISAFSTYHSNKIICQFVASMNDKARNGNYGLIWVTIDSIEDKPLNLKLAALCDKTIRM